MNAMAPTTCHKPIPTRGGLNRRCWFKPTVCRSGKWFCTRHDPLRHLNGLDK